eukprot:363678-Chlamydomonas_euryale.AAC.1
MGFWPGGGGVRRPSEIRQNSVFDGDRSHFDPICELAMKGTCPRSVRASSPPFPLTPRPPPPLLPGHAWLSVADAEYWAFSFDEVASACVNSDPHPEGYCAIVDVRLRVRVPCACVESAYPGGVVPADRFVWQICKTATRLNCEAKWQEENVRPTTPARTDPPCPPTPACPWPPARLPLPGPGHRPGLTLARPPTRPPGCVKRWSAGTQVRPARATG